MRNIFLLTAALAVIGSCVTTTKVQVTPLGQEPPEVLERYIYALPQSVLKVEVVCREVSSIPGPYWEYADRYLGINEVIRQKTSMWVIEDVKVSHHVEMDPQQIYSLNVLEGEFSQSFLDAQIERGNIVNMQSMISEKLEGPVPVLNNKNDLLKYVDLGIYSNFKERTETMYKTLVTDTSFVRVPVERTIIEQKSPVTKAEEAAEFLLDLRTARFELLSGAYEVYPDGEAMAATIEKLDELENSYLSLFIGKTITRTIKRDYFIVPESGKSASSYRLDMFSGLLGFVPEELMEGQPLEIQIKPEGKTWDLENYFTGAAENDRYNEWYYRVPDVAELSVVLGEEVLSKQRISLYQSGAVVAAPVNR